MSEARQLDARDLKCPLPVLRARKAMKDVPSGGLLEVQATDPGAPADFEAFCEDRSIRIPFDDKVTADLRMVRKETTASGNIRFVADGEGDSHADRFWALALALHALAAEWRAWWAATGRPRLTAPDRAFLGWLRARRSASSSASMLGQRSSGATAIQLGVEAIRRGDVAFSPDGLLIAAATESNRVDLFGVRQVLESGG